MSPFEQKQIERYLTRLSRLSHDARLELIARLSESLKEVHSTAAQAEKRSVDHLFGAWDSEETAEELIQSIRAARTPNSDPEPFE